VPAWSFGGGPGAGRGVRAHSALALGHDGTRRKHEIQPSDWKVTVASIG